MRITAAALTLSSILAAGPSFGQSTTYNSRCGWTQGVYRCNSKFETSRSVTTTTCTSGHRGAGCTSETVEKPVYYNTEVHVPDPIEAGNRAALPHNDPGAIPLCAPPHKMTR